MKKVLFTATLVRGHIAKFHIPYLKWFKEQGWETWVAARNDCESSYQIPFCDHFVDISFPRSPFSIGIIGAYSELRQLFKSERFDLVHTHTPVGSVLTRLAIRSQRHSGTKVIYTAHGFHFYNGAPIANWLLWYPVERCMSHYCDLLLTINYEDYSRAKRFAGCEVGYVPGVGFAPRVETGISVAEGMVDICRDNKFVILAVGDLNKNKNHELIIRALPKLPSECVLYIAGEGGLRQRLAMLAESLAISDRVFFLGFCSNIPELLDKADLFVMPSYREGLPISLLEAMNAGLPCVVTDCRGSSDLLADWPEFIVPCDDFNQLAISVQKLFESPELRHEVGESLKRKADGYAIDKALSAHASYYTKLMGDDNGR